MSPLFFKRLSDEILGSRLAAGEAAAFDELYRRYANRLAAYGGHLLGDTGLGDDVAQATMLKAYGALREGRVPDRMKPWLFRIAHNVAIDLVVRRRELPSDDLPESPAVDREPFAGTLVEALATLPDRQRRVYVLREVHGLRIDETATELGLTAAQVEQALFAARNRLAEQLVFGNRLNCVTVQRLAGGPLDAAERRALKTHLRTCNTCRQTLGLRGRALSLFPAGMSLEWLPRLGAGLLSGGAPAAAKVGAVVATATIAAGVPVAVERTAHHHAHRPAVPRTALADSVVSIRPVAQVAPVAARAPSVAPPQTMAVWRAERHGSTGRGPRPATDGARHRSGSTEAEHKGGGSSARGSGERDPGDHGSSGASSSGSGDIGSSKESGDSGDSHSGDSHSGDSHSGDSHSGDSHSGDSHSGSSHSGDGDVTATTATRESGDRHGSSPATTTMAPTLKSESDTNGGGDSPTSGDGSQGGDAGSGSGDGSHGGGGDGGGGGDSHSGGGDDTTTTTTATTTTTTTTSTTTVPVPNS